MSIGAGKSRSKSITLLPALNYHPEHRTLSVRFLTFYVSLYW